MPDPAADRLAELAAGLLGGLVAALACLWLWSRARDRPPAVAGLALAAAAAAGYAVTGVPAPPDPAWPVLALATAAAAAALAGFDRRWRGLGLAPVLLAVTAAGIWATVPDVEAALVLLGAALPLALLGWPLLLARRAPRRPPPAFGVAGSLAVAGVLVWAVASGGAGRPGSVVGGLACLGLLAVEPAVRGLDPRRRSPLDPLEGRPGLAWAALATQLALVAVAARVVGRPESAAMALGLAALELGLAVAAGAAVTRRPSRSRRSAP